MRKLIVGNTTEAAIRLLFDQRIAQESNDPSFNSVERAQNIKNIKSQIMGFINRNPNSRFDLIVPEYKNDKVVTLSFDNFDADGSDEDISNYKVIVKDNFVEADIIHKVILGKDIVLKIKASSV